MLKQSQKSKDQKGFTIIEVLIVLAIAGLILLIVFLAVPALQRNSRNTQRKADIQALLGAASEFSANNSGAIPTVACGAANPRSLNTGTCAVPTGAAANFNIGYYTAVPTLVAGVQAAIATDTLQLVTGAKCGAAGATVAGSARQVAAQYEIETGSALVATCTDS
jgi:prepilin-type N-terminal cleavage/methylation domain-containing protein